MAEGPSEVEPRKRCATTTRESILAAAIHRFSTEGYDRAGVRQIAGDAGVTAALVNRYFGSKEGLYAEVLERAFDLGDFFDGPSDGLPERLARRVIGGENEAGNAPLLLILRSATEPHAAAMMRSWFDRAFIRPLAEKLGGPDANARAALISAQLTGFATLDKLIQIRPFAEADRERLVTLLTNALTASFRDYSVG